MTPATTRPICETDCKTRVVVLGGGFGGIYAVQELERLFAGDDSVQITLVNQDNFFVFTPMLHEVAASDLDLTHIVNPIRKLLRRAAFFHGAVRRVDLEEKVVEVAHGVDDDHVHRLEYDHLVLALGSVTNFFGTPGLAEHAFTMKTLADAIALRNRIIDSLEESDFECFPEVRRRLMTFVVAGGGFAGVETIAAIHDFMHEAIAHYPHLEHEHVRMVLVHPGEVILPELTRKLGLYAQKKLGKRGIEIHLGTKVAGLTAEGVALSDGTTIPTANLIWTAGTSPHPLLEQLACAKERGRILVDEFLQVHGHDGLWGLGDCAMVPDKAKGGFCPPTAQHASRQGVVLARNLAAAIRGGRKRPFAFKTMGQLAAIGRRSGVANILGINFSGFVAWWLWRTIYLMKLPRFERKVRVALDWSLDLLFTKDLVHCPTARATSAAARRDVAPPVAALRAAS
jgi:NADH:ubiquinone reductase (H+-translocating)